MTEPRVIGNVAWRGTTGNLMIVPILQGERVESTRSRAARAIENQHPGRQDLQDDLRFAKPHLHLLSKVVTGPEPKVPDVPEASL